MSPLDVGQSREQSTGAKGVDGPAECEASGDARLAHHPTGRRMTRYWSAELGTYIDGEALAFTGPQARYSLLDGEGRQQREAPITGDYGFGEYVQPKDVRAKRAKTVRRVKPPTHTHCVECRHPLAPAEVGRRNRRCEQCRTKDTTVTPKSEGRVIWAHCRGCRVRQSIKRLTAKLRLCACCRDGRQRAVRYPAA